ncbi:MAG: hypothetical protein M1838_002777 [Thelocarpon superellum]|nr:MAG: hypothetical protein M1838_002777 [Thelocarpon superellum]
MDRVLQGLPDQLRDLVHATSDPAGGGSRQALAAIALDPAWTQIIFLSDPNLFVDYCGHWLSAVRSHELPSLPVLSAIARVLPVAPHLAGYLDAIIHDPSVDSPTDPSNDAWVFLSPRVELDPNTLPDEQLLDLLLTAVRLLTFDNAAYARAISPVKLPWLLSHPSRSVRYLAVRLLRLYLHAADFFMEAMLQKHLGVGAVEGPWDGKTVDYAFLTLWEEKRLAELGEAMRSPKGQASIWSSTSPWTADIAGQFMPRLHGPPAQPSQLLHTPTTHANLRRLAEAVRSPDPVLVSGAPGCGKTTLVAEVARELGADQTSLTLHLNEQTDAKLLIGMYTTAATPGSFVWHPGVLTTAVREGRWVLIEDLDRAPTDVVSVLLPLLERRELMIPNRGEVIRAARSFKLIATIRTTRNARGGDSMPASHMLGGRFWRQVPLRMPELPEFYDIVSHRYSVDSYLSTITQVYQRLDGLMRDAAFLRQTNTSLRRPISPRDLLKWCRRVETIVSAAPAGSSAETVSEHTIDCIYLDAADCFAAAITTVDARAVLLTAVAQELNMPPQRVEYYRSSYAPEINLRTSPPGLAIGRATLVIPRPTGRERSRRSAGSGRPFARTKHSLRLLEQVAVAVQMAEPVLLVGETGVGKTAVVQQLADHAGHELCVVNLSQQSESADLLGGFKPVTARSLAVPMKDEFDDLFDRTFDVRKNPRYVEMLGKCVAKGQWTRVLLLWKEALSMLEGIDVVPPTPAGTETDPPKKKRRVTAARDPTHHARWQKFAGDVATFEQQLARGSHGFAFQYLEGNVVRAVRRGAWVLLDEINLAAADTLESIADLLHAGAHGRPSLLLSEKGDIERVSAHPDFRIFAAMNPATDVGKKDLPPGLRARFTEIFVDSPDRDVPDLMRIVAAYLSEAARHDRLAAHDVAHLYVAVRQLAEEDRLVDGAGQRPHFSLRTLTRTLTYVADIAATYGLRRSLYEGFSMTFLTLLDPTSERVVSPLIYRHLLGAHRNAAALLRQPPRVPDDGHDYVPFEHYWLRQGELPLETQPHYIITPSVRRNLLNLIRATSSRRFPVLIQGPTSSGKTSMIEYLAKTTGSRFVRINNHEHTDLQEYLGSYVSADDGRLYFREGLLVDALRHGHWIVLDELNLAPTDVLEALNRLLDDNRELWIPETQTVVRPHSNFMLFATQNPAGLYGGRKVLSRAFRNRFLELHFDDIPEEELETILRERTQIAPSFCTRIVAVYKDLALLRQSGRVFEQRHSFATLRDLFRWAWRPADNREQLAANGYMLLAERVRKPEEKEAVQQVIEKVMKVSIDPVALYAGPVTTAATGTEIVWTKAMRRLRVLVARALERHEPVLLVGDTGCGKTTICQALATEWGKTLSTVNAHQNLETGDLIGAQRPVRRRGAIESQLRQDLAHVLSSERGPGADGDESLEALLDAFAQLRPEDASRVPDEVRVRIGSNQRTRRTLFAWYDGALVQAMRAGHFFLLDEISLADDSVLERLNSVLESDRSLLLAEKGADGLDDARVQAQPGFQFLATMNPGGDYGKRELSPALRNRFTEIWVPPSAELEDLVQIAEARLPLSLTPFAPAMVRFAEWFSTTFTLSTAAAISIRDVLAWVDFVRHCTMPDPFLALLHGAAMVFIDALGANPAAMLAIAPDRVTTERQRCLTRLGELLHEDLHGRYMAPIQISRSASALTVGPFSVAAVGPAQADPSITLQAPTTRQNAMRVVRGLQVRKPILLEGSPGVGKTTLVTALARALGRPLTRINLSEQTDLMDLFGSDVPVEGAAAGHFTWRDAPFLRAMQQGEWVLLDEMNLASQSVLEGLNACLDHRAEVYVAELDQTFTAHPNFVLFAAQNPHHQGGGRRGLPSSFVNRFTVVYADVFTLDDLTLISAQSFPSYPPADLEALVRFVARLEAAVNQHRHAGMQGGPWEFNLRDVLRWLQLLTAQEQLLPAGTVADYLDLICTQRFRTAGDQATVQTLYAEIMGEACPPRSLYHHLGPSCVQVGRAVLDRDRWFQSVPFPVGGHLTAHLPILESLMICVQQRWPSILVGAAGSGKTTILRRLAAIVGAELVEFALDANMDTMDLIGGYEQVDRHRQANLVRLELERMLRHQIMLASETGAPPTAWLALLGDLQLRTTDAGSIRDRLRALFPPLPHHGEDEARVLAHVDVLPGPSNDATERASFQWVDGILVRALEAGHWLVLDHANLCSASVLDRLNALLEPDGVLSINEQRTADGEARVVRPHPSFRLFLTVDPRYGELSRAMRNRAIEIFVAAPGGRLAHPEAETCVALGGCESRVARYRTFMQMALHRPADLLSPWFVSAGLDHLSLGDASMLQQWRTQIHTGLIEELTPRVRLGLDAAIDRTAKLIEDVGFTKSSVITYYAHATKTTSLRVPDQPLHPLGNELLLAMFPRERPAPQPSAIALAYELIQEALKMAHRLDEVRTQARAFQPSQMSRLVRSCAAPRMQHQPRDGSAPLYPFLDDLHQRLLVWARMLLTADSSAEYDERMPISLQDLTLLWWMTVELADDRTSDDVTFRAYLSLWDRLPARFTERHARHLGLSTSLERSVARLTPAWQLSSGLSMDRLWMAYRPALPSHERSLQSLLHLQQLAARFDAVVWSGPAALCAIVELRGSMQAAAIAITRHDADMRGHLQVAEEAIAALEASAAGGPPTRPYFQEVFEGLCQHRDLLRWQPRDMLKMPLSLDPLLPLFAARASTWAPSSKNVGSVSASIFHDLSSYRAGGQNAVQQRMALTGRLPTVILDKLHGLSNATLGQLALVREEVTILGQHLAEETTILYVDQLRLLSACLARLLYEVLQAHRDVVDEDERQEEVQILLAICHLQDDGKGSMPLGPPSAISDSTSSDGSVLQIWNGLIRPSILALQSAQAPGVSFSLELSKAWILFALGVLQLFVPDRTYDPAVKDTVARQVHDRCRASLTDQCRALEQFQVIFTGKANSRRAERLKEQLGLLADVPPTSTVARPAVSEMERLQADFTNLLTTVVKPLRPSIGKPFFPEGDSWSRDTIMVQSSLAQLVERLTSAYPYYRDLTQPAVGLLHALDLGLSMASWSHAGEGAGSSLTEMISHETPFLGGHPSVLFGAFLGDASSTVPGPAEARTHYLEWMTAVARVECLDRLPLVAHEKLMATFDAFYREWKERLVADQEKASAQSGLYRYRGGEEETEALDNEAFHELFPAYEEESAPVNERQKATAPRERTLMHAQLHHDLFAGATTSSAPSGILLQLLKNSGVRLARATVATSTSGRRQTSTKDLLAAVLYTLHLEREHLVAATPTSTSRTYNFYTDANLAEAAQLVRLIHRVQQRFLQLQMAWPEHATLQDVRTTCDEVLAFRHVEPVAKFLTKVEKLHGYMHQWQTVASTSFSAQGLYEEVTKLLVDWRRLELVTWTRLFDLEQDKCAQDAQLWWNVAYEVIVAVPLSLLETDAAGLARYGIELLSSLETFFATTTLGQFSRRLQLLERFRSHVLLIAQRTVPMTTIAAALTNFIDYYARFEPEVNRALDEGRRRLEKDVTEVVRLASWKDTNINALRESAKRSHHQLFKLVRKYRAVLATSVGPLIARGLPGKPITGVAPGPQNVDKSHSTLVDPRALSICQESIPEWSLRPPRFVNVHTTVEVMQRVAQIPETAEDIPQALEQFSMHLVSSMESLQKQTPTLLTDANKDQLKHLKTRKRLLFADTLKALRLMGVRHNLGANSLAQQADLATVLASLDPVPRETDVPGLGDMTVAFHHVIDLMPRVRQSQNSHADDLSSAEIVRSVGYLEGLLLVLCTQHATLTTALQRLVELQGAVKKLDSLWGSEDRLLLPNPRDRMNLTTAWSRVTNWLPSILETAQRLVQAHGELGRLDHSTILHRLHYWRDRFAAVVAEWKRLPLMPTGITTTEHHRWQTGSTSLVQELRQDLDKWTREQPLLECIICQIIPWTELYQTSHGTAATTNGHHSITVHDFDQSLLHVCDSILVALQRMQQATKTGPISTEEPAWLVLHEQSLASSIQELHAMDVRTTLEHALHQSSRLDLADHGTAKAVSALSAMTAPIIQQYCIIYRQRVEAYATVVQSSCRMTHVLAKSFTHLATHGFCTPAETSKTDEQKGKVEEGTGLGEGDGAQDISKDVQDDEDLSELAQEPQRDDQGEVEDEQDAVDMQDDLNGQMGDVSDKGDDTDGSGDEGDEIDEETGVVDDLDPSAVDEKMWDGAGEEAEKNQETDQSGRKSKKDEQTAAKESADQGGDRSEGAEVDEVDDGGVDEEEQVGADEPEKADPHTTEGETLDLPDDIELDGEKGGDKAEDDIHDMDDVDDMDDMDDLNEMDGEDEKGNVPDEMTELEAGEDEIKGEDEMEEGENDMRTREMEEQSREEEDDGSSEASQDLQRMQDEAGNGKDETDHANDQTTKGEDTMTSDAQGLGADQQMTDEHDDPSYQARRQEGSKGASAENDASTEQGQGTRQDQREADVEPGPQEDSLQATPQSQALKKLGDALERWHRQRKAIQPASEDQQRDQAADVEMQDEFEHLGMDEVGADTQALGATTEDQAHALDDAMAVDREMSGHDEEGDEERDEDEVTRNQTENEKEVRSEEDPQIGEGETWTRIGRTQTTSDDAVSDAIPASPSISVSGRDTPSSPNPTPLPANPSATLGALSARTQWEHYEGTTRQLSQTLTEQLRLILHPSIASKLRGDFRTGKRLNMKRIIPYIASGYKRDKIWLRRAVPHKRAYQILLAVDDSSSMADQGAGERALETLVMVSQALKLLEVGQVAVVAFGSHTIVAHPFSPSSSGNSTVSGEAGAAMLSHFTFSQRGTDIRELLSTSMRLFHDARLHSPSSSSSAGSAQGASPVSLWQLQFIVSDGLVHSDRRDDLARMVRAALAERIMVVFLIVDAPSSSTVDGEGKKGKGKGSIVNLTTATFSSDLRTDEDGADGDGESGGKGSGAGKVTMTKYLDAFPFPYYIIVRDVRDLPSVLAEALRGWFAQVVDAT